MNPHIHIPQFQQFTNSWPILLRPRPLSVVDYFEADLRYHIIEDLWQESDIISFVF